MQETLTRSDMRTTREWVSRIFSSCVQNTEENSQLSPFSVSIGHRHDIQNRGKHDWKDAEFLQSWLFITKFDRSVVQERTKRRPHGMTPELDLRNRQLLQIGIWWISNGSRLGTEKLAKTPTGISTFITWELIPIGAATQFSHPYSEPLLIS